jgi:hypothetical protein
MNPPEPNRPLIEVRCEGDPEAMGFSQGKALREKIQGAREMLRDLEVFRHRQPFCLPFSVFRWLAEQKAQALLSRALAVHSPETAQRLAGLADGAQIRPASLHLLNILEPFLSSVGAIVAPPAACSALAVRGPRSAIAEPVVARNFDYLPLVQPCFTLRECRPQKGFRSIEFTMGPLAGAVDGMNEAGLCITYNYAFGTDEPPAPALPLSMIISETLSRCSNVTEAVQWIESRPGWGGRAPDAGRRRGRPRLAGNHQHPQPGPPP